MPVEYTCPECRNSVLVPDKVAGLLGTGREIGCGNEEEHESGSPLVMWRSADPEERQ